MKLVEMLIKTSQDEDDEFQPRKLHEELISQLGDRSDSSMLVGIYGAVAAIHLYGIPDDLDELMEVL